MTRAVEGRFSLAQALVILSRQHKHAPFSLSVTTRQREIRNMESRERESSRLTEVSEKEYNTETLPSLAFTRFVWLAFALWPW